MEPAAVELTSTVIRTDVDSEDESGETTNKTQKSRSHLTSMMSSFRSTVLGNMCQLSTYAMESINLVAVSENFARNATGSDLEGKV